MKITESVQQIDWHTVLAQCHHGVAEEILVHVRLQTTDPPMEGRMEKIVKQSGSGDSSQ